MPTAIVEVQVCIDSIQKRQFYLNALMSHLVIICFLIFAALGQWVIITFLLGHQSSQDLKPFAVKINLIQVD